MEKTYPTNLLIKLFNLYDPSMNRLDPWMDWNQQRRNKSQIKKAVQLTPLISEVLSVSLNQLDERRKSILLARYKDGKTLRECGEQYGISAERTRQLSETAIDQMRKQASVPFFALIWPETGSLTPNEWLTWVINYCTNDAKKPDLYNDIPTDCQSIIVSKVSMHAKETYENAVNKGDK